MDGVASSIFIHPLHTDAKDIFVDASYLYDVSFLPKECVKVLFGLEDIEHALTHQTGTLWEILRTLFGWVDQKGKAYPPRPDIYHRFAYTAAAVLSSKLSLTGVREAFDKDITGQEVSMFINTHGFYGFKEEIEKKERKLINRSNYVAVFARMFNADRRFGRTENSLGLRDDKYVLQVNDSRRPRPRYCIHCKVIDDYWTRTSLDPTNPEHIERHTELMETYNFAAIKSPFSKAIRGELLVPTYEHFADNCFIGDPLKVTWDDLDDPYTENEQ